MTNAQKPLINVHAEVSSRARGLIFRLSLPFWGVVSVDLLVAMTVDAVQAVLLVMNSSPINGAKKFDNGPYCTMPSFMKLRTFLTVSGL